MVVNVVNVVVGGNASEAGVVSAATSALEFELTLELVRAVAGGASEMMVEWKMVYVFGENSSLDQVLDSVELGPLPVATMKFVFSAHPPNLFLVSKEEQLDIGAVYISGLYRGQEFIRIGYYVKHDYIAGSVPVDPVTGQEIHPEILQLEKVVRRIDAANPRVTRFVIKWDDAEADPLQPPPVTYADMDMDAEPEDQDEDEEEEEEEDEDSCEEEEEISIEDEEAEAEAEAENGGAEKANGLGHAQMQEARGKEGEEGSKMFASS